MIEVSRYDAAEHLTTKEHCIEYLNAAAEENDTTIELFFAMMDDIVRSEGARASLQSAGLDTAELQTALAADIYDRLDASMKILRALGVRMTFSSVKAPSREAELEYAVQAAP